MDGGVEQGLDQVIPKLVELFETYGYDVEQEQFLEIFEEAGLEVVTVEDYEDYRHG